MKKLKHRFEYALVAFLDFLLHVPPRAAALWIGEKIGAALSFVLFSRRQLIHRNLEKSFPSKSAAERQRIASRFWKNLGRTAVEFVRSDDITAENFDRYFQIQGKENMDRALALGNGAIVITAHFTNWEMSGISMKYLFKDMRVIARPMKNPYVQRWVESKRKLGGMDVILHREAVKASFKWLKQKKIIGILVDQNLYTGGIFVDFFGRPAATTTLPALLSIRTGAPIICVYTLRENKGFRLYIDPALPVSLTEDLEKDIETVTQSLTKRLERLISEHPENWFWIHNRWKRQPEAVH